MNSEMQTTISTVRTTAGPWGITPLVLEWGSKGLLWWTLCSKHGWGQAATLPLPWGRLQDWPHLGTNFWGRKAGRKQWDRDQVSPLLLYFLGALSSPSTPFLAFFLAYFVDSLGVLLLHEWRKCFLLGLRRSLPCHSLGRVESLSTDSLPHWLWKLKLKIPLCPSDLLC